MNEAVLRALVPAVALSGAAGLLYQTLWLRLLAVQLGSGTTAVCLILSVFMGGLALGGWLIGRRADRSPAPVRLYAVVEVAKAVYCAFTPFLFRTFESGWGVIFILPPALAMGGTLPLLARLGAAEGRLGERIGSLYFWNTLGGALGAASSAFLVPSAGVSAAMLAAMALNLAAAGVAWRAPPAMAVPAAVGKDAPADFPVWAWPAFAVCGALTLAHEALWTRLLALVLGSSAQSFAVMLTAFLFGLAWGGRLAGKLAARAGGVLPALGWAQLGAGTAATAALALYPFLSEAYLALFAGLGRHPRLFLFAQFLTVAGVLALPAALLGAAFPLAAAAMRSRRRAGTAVGAVFALNTFGAMLGPWLAAFVLVPRLGLSGACFALAAAGVALGAFALAWGAQGRARAAGLAAACVAALFWMGAPALTPQVLQAGTAVYASEMLSARIRPAAWRETGGYRLLFAEDGREASVSVWGSERGALSLIINGKADASNQEDMAVQTLLGHLPLLVAPEIAREGARALVIGLGSGVTAAAVARHPFAQVEVAEIEPAVARAAALFSPANRDILHDPKARLFLNDARAHLRDSGARYGLIVSEPSNPWIAGMSHLFSAEFFALVRRRLDENGVFCQWLPTYRMTPEALGTALETLRRAFPCVTVWILNKNLILTASSQPVRPDFQRMLSVMSSPGVREDLAGLGIASPSDILALRLLGERSLGALTADLLARVHTDDRPVLEALAPAAMRDPDAGTRNAERLERRAEPVSAAVDGAAGQELGLARSLIAAGRADAAARGLEALAPGDPWRDGLERDLGELYLRRGRADAAAGIFEARARRRPADPVARLDMARAHLEAGRREDALEALAVYARLAAPGRRLGEVFARARRESASAPAFLAVAMAYAKHGENRLADAAFEQVLMRDPGLLGASAGEVHFHGGWNHTIRPAGQ